MFYRIEAYDHEGQGERRQALRDRHIAYWRELGLKVAAAGAILDSDCENALPIGSIIIVEADSAEEAAAMLERDPFTIEGVFSSRSTLTRWRPAIGRWYD
jgi:uncharacterized protein YciI